MVISPSREQEDHVIYYNDGFNQTNIRLHGAAIIHPNGLLQLTNTSNNKIGHAFYSYPFQFRGNSSHGVAEPLSFSFSTCFVVAVVPAYHSLMSGHGLAFTISPSRGFPAAMAGEYLGIFSTSNNGNPSNHVLAIELDTLLDPELGDIDKNHVGIDENGLNSTNSAPAAYYDNEDGECRNFSLTSGEPIQVWVDYDGVAKQLNVTVSPSTVPKPNRPLLSSSIDLSSVVKDSMYVGFSASTGSGTAGSHYILGWSFQMNGKAQQLHLSKLPSLPRTEQSRGNLVLKIGLSLAAVVFFAVTTISVTMYILRKKKSEEIQEDWEEEYGPHRFSYNDLSIATKGFGERELLGVGGFGKVYRGVLPTSNVQVAVKRVSHESKQGMREFIAEIASIGKLRHRNLVRLLGYCRRKGELLLVYDFMFNGSLDKFLFSSERPVLNWDQRYKILRDVASGLLYLHEGWEQVVLHRDVKASNILLDADLNGKLGDFGLSRLYDHGTNAQTSRTLGYLAHELTRTGKATISADVFSFGVVMLEVACGRRPIDLHASPEEENLVDWVTEFWKRGSLLEARDCKLGNDYVVKELELVLKLGLLCSHPVPAARPTMRQVTQYLDGDAVLPELPLDVSTYSCTIAALCKKGLDHFYSKNGSSEQASAPSSFTSTESIILAIES
ncbi:hypothetical protein AAC387_Pa05g3828 [Persea americana]